MYVCYIMTKFLETGDRAGASSLEAWGLPSRDSVPSPPYLGGIPSKLPSIRRLAKLRIPCQPKRQAIDILAQSNMGGLYPCRY
ncbi:hypothetical protein LI328DRAFT_135129, partial [Trichoderma asperelloides]